MTEMWRSTGGKDVKTITQSKNDDEWETDADFVVSCSEFTQRAINKQLWVREEGEDKEGGS